MAYFFVFIADDSKQSVTVWVKYLSASERSYLALLEKYYGLLSPELLLARCQSLKIQDFVCCCFFGNSAGLFYIPLISHSNSYAY